MASTKRWSGLPSAAAAATSAAASAYPFGEPEAREFNSRTNAFAWLSAAAKDIATTAKSDIILNFIFCNLYFVFVLNYTIFSEQINPTPQCS